MIQFPINLNDATTAHKLQDASKDKLIVNSWCTSHGWVYTVLSRVRTLTGLFLTKPLKWKQSKFDLPPELINFRRRLMKKVPEKARAV